MKKARFRERLAWAKFVYPGLRSASPTLLLRAPKDLDPIRSWDLKVSKETKSNDVNYLTVFHADLARYWLYFDLNPEASDQKVQDWFRAYLSTSLSVYEEAEECVYELTRRNVLPKLSIKQFKSALKRYGISCNVILGPLWPRVEAYLLNQQDRVNVPVDLVREILQWTRLNCRMTIDNPALEQAAADDYAATQARLRDIWATQDDDRDRTCTDLNRILREWIPRDFHPLPGHHGNGAVAESVPDRLASIKCHYLNRHSQLVSWYMARYDVDVRSDLPVFLTGRSSRPPLVKEARFTSVAKNLQKRRGIAPQPVLLMWLQQGILDAYYEQVWSQPYVRRHFPIFTREINQARAVIGSLRNCYATIDMKAASDSISVHLVKRVMPAPLRNALCACRCTSTTAHSEVETYGNMGDATVFPTETLIIGACAKLALTRASAFDPAIDTEAYWVFGDDVVIVNNWLVLHFLHEIFDELGFIINEDKTFVDGPYRESCGVEAWLGVEVQPFYFFNRSEIAIGRAERLAQLIGAANNAYSRGLKWLRLSCLDQLQECCYGRMELVPFTDNAADPSHVYTPFLSERGHFRRRAGGFTYSKDKVRGENFVLYSKSVPSESGLQCLERECCLPKTRRSFKNVDRSYEDWYRYYMYLLDPPPRAEFSRSYVNHNLRMSKKWEAVP